MIAVQTSGWRAAFQRMAMLISCTAVLVFFSEKAYWYPQGFAIAELLLFYGLIVFATLWTVDFFRVRRTAPLVLTAALYGFLVEGILTPVMFEGGLLSPIMPAYFVGWHGLVALVFGWVWIRRRLVAGQWGCLLAGSLVFGLLWGIWSITYWLPESGEHFARPGQWPVVDFALYALTYTGMLAAAHWILGQGAWTVRFQPGRLEKGVALAGLIFCYLTLSLPGAPLGLLMLLPLLGLIGGLLWLNRRREPAGSLLSDVQGPIRPHHLLLLIVMPITAVAAYAGATFLNPDLETIRAVMELFNLGLLGAGGIAFLWALPATLRSVTRS